MRLAIAITMIALTSLTAVAQTETKVFEAPLKDGKITVVPKADTENAAPGFSTLEGGTANTFTPPSAWQDALQNQEVYVGKDAVSGKITSIFTVPKGTSITADAMFNSAPAGTVFAQVPASSLASYFLPTDAEIQIALERLLSTAQTSVCKMKSRPTTFQLAVNVQAGVGVEGGVSLSAEWETKELCK